MSSEKVGFAGSSQGLLVGVLERPDHAPLQALAVFAHCFTCGKNSLAATRISRALAQQGIATLRFDFTGLGESEGDFGRGGFSSSVADIVAAVHWMQSTIGMPALLVGHSLGGTAAIAAAARLDGIRAVCTLGAPATADHVLRHFGPTKSEEDGQIQVDLGGRAFRIAPAFIEELQAQAHENPVKGLRAALLVMHAPSDAVVDIGEAQDLFKAARHPKSFISLDDADHLLTRPADAQYAADLIGAWASRFLPMRAERNDAPSDLRAGEVWVGEHDHAFWRSMRAGPHHLNADEPKEVGGGERGPDPYELLLMSLGACTSMTLRQYAKRKGYALKDVQVRLRHERAHATDCQECGDRSGQVDHVTRQLLLSGPLSESQRQDLLRIADRCPVHRTLENHPVITTTLIRD